MAYTEAKLDQLQVVIRLETFPPYHESHGTPHPVVQRSFIFQFPQGTAEVDQTDYGHPGRFNPCHAKNIALALQPITGKIVSAAESLAALLD